MQAVCDTAFPYAHDRKQFGRPIGKFQLIQGKMAEMYSTLAACRAFTYTTIRAAERDDLTNHDCAALLLYVSEAATKVALDGIQILGGNGYSEFIFLITITKHHSSQRLSDWAFPS